MIRSSVYTVKELQNITGRSVAQDHIFVREAS